MSNSWGEIAGQCGEVAARWRETGRKLDLIINRLDRSIQKMERSVQLYFWQALTWGLCTVLIGLVVLAAVVSGYTGDLKFTEIATVGSCLIMFLFSIFAVFWIVKTESKGRGS